MTPKSARSYHCKGEELPVIGEYVLFSLKRDLATFAGYSPKFDDSYVAAFDGKITAVNELVSPRIETAELKATTARLYATMREFIYTTRRLEGYIKLAKNKVPVSLADFGTIALRKKLHSRDSEGVLYNLQLVIANTNKFKEQLVAEGLTEDLEAQLAKAFASITQDNQRQFELLSGRKMLVQDKVKAFNALSAQLTEICNVGKILFKSTNPGRAKEYTFVYLLKQVRIVRRK